MSNFNRKCIVVIFFLIVALMLVFKVEHSKSNIINKVNLSNLPLNIKHWKGVDIQSPDYVFEILETKDVLTRRYIDGHGNGIVLTVICSDHNNGAFHPPEVCYAGGSELQFLEKVDENVLIGDHDYISTKKLYLKTSYGFTKVWYWFMVDGKFFGNFYSQQVALFMNLLRGKSTQAAMIKVTVNSKNEPDEDLAKQFIKLIKPYIVGIF